MKQVYDIKTSKQYERDVKLAARRGLDIVTFLLYLCSRLLKLKQKYNHSIS